MRKKQSKKVVALFTMIIMIFTCIMPFTVLSNAAAIKAVKIKVALDKTSATMNKGDTLNLSATVTPDTITDASISWNSSAPDIATVGTNGVITAVGKGKATIMATSNSDSTKSAKCKITVKVPVSAVYLNTAKIETTLGAKTVKLSGTLFPTTANFKAKALTWTSSNSSVASVSAGEVTYVGEGSAIITATADNAVAGNCTVTVSTLSVTDLLKNVETCDVVNVPTNSGLGGKTLKVSLDQKSVSVDMGSRTTISAIIAPDDLSNKDIAWVSSNTSVATVNQKGVVTGLSKGSATITAYSEYDGSKSAKCSVKVNVPATEIQLNTNKIDTVVGASFLQLKATVYPSAASQKLTWASSNSSVASVDAKGKVTSVSVGSATITATASNDVVGKCDVVVSEVDEDSGGGSTVRPTPTATPNSNGVKAIDGGWESSFILMNDGTVKAFGWNYSGKLGLGPDISVRYLPTTIPNISDVKAISAGWSHTILLMNDSTLKTFGDNRYGQLGLGDTLNRTTPVSISGISGIKAISVGKDYSILLMNDGTLKSFGENYSGKLGLGDISNRNVPVSIPNISGVKEISTGDEHSIILMNDGTVKTFGDNSYGQLGLGDTLKRTIPVTIPNISGVSDISAGGNHTILLMNDGTVKTFGRNNYGQLGLGDNTDRTTPIAISIVSGVKDIIAGSAHSMLLMNDGTVKTFGVNIDGQLGLGDNNNRNLPETIKDISGVSSIGAGWDHSLLLMNDGNVKSFGTNTWGSLGLADFKNRNIPISIIIPTPTPSPTNTPTPTPTPKLTTNMVVGDYVKFGAYDANKDGVRESDEEILWRVIDNTGGTPLLFSEYILCLKPFDAAESGTNGNGATDREKHGSSYWGDSNLRDWLNSYSSSVVYSSQAPTNNAVSFYYNDYSAEKGFLSSFTVYERNAILSKSNKVLIPAIDSSMKDGGTENHLFTYVTMDAVMQNYDTTAYYKNFADGVRLLSVKEIKEYLFDKTIEYRRKPTAKAISCSELKDARLNLSNYWFYWTNTPYTSCSSFLRIIGSTDSVYHNTVDDGAGGIAPALNLKSGITIIRGTGTVSDPYVLQ